MSQLHRTKLMVKVPQLGQLGELEESEWCHTFHIYCSTDKGEVVRRGCQGVAELLGPPSELDLLLEDVAADPHETKDVLSFALVRAQEGLSNDYSLVDHGDPTLDED